MFECKKDKEIEKLNQRLEYYISMVDAYKDICDDLINLNKRLLHNLHNQISKD